MREQFVSYIKNLQDQITSKLEAIDGKATFKLDVKIDYLKLDDL